MLLQRGEWEGKIFKFSNSIHEGEKRWNLEDKYPFFEERRSAYNIRFQLLHWLLFRKYQRAFDALVLIDKSNTLRQPHHPKEDVKSKFQAI